MAEEKKKKDFLDRLMAAPGKIMDDSANVINRLADKGEKTATKVSKKFKVAADE